MQAKRINLILSPNINSGAFAAVTLDVPDDPREEVNFHNIWASFTCEPKDTEANAQGNWALYIVKVGGAVFNPSDALIAAETNNFFIIALGVWGASNQSPYNSPPIHPLTSRTLSPGDKLALSVGATGVTVGNVSMKMCLSAHTVRK